jgi:alkaline phosphatase D
MLPGVIDRRRLLAGMGGFGLGAITGACSRSQQSQPARTSATPTVVTTTTRPVPKLAGNPFTLGVASGDPLPESVILWTRLAPDPLGGGGMPTDPVDVRWEVALDDEFSKVVRTGVFTAEAGTAHSLHVDADGLEPATEYRYRFSVGEWISPVGRTRTAPEPGATPDRLRFGVGSCQNWESGYYNAHRDIAGAGLDLMVFLGDYIYEYGPSGRGVRAHNSPEVTDLVGYRNRYALYRTDPHLQAAHAACPWAVIWDDHEVENNYANDRSEDTAVSPEEFLIRRAAAYRAWWEHQPVRLEVPDGPDLAIHRQLRWGGLVDLFLLDGRQYRTDQACGDITLSFAPACGEQNSPGRTMLGQDQEEWLLASLDASSAAWTALGNQVVMTPLTVGEAILNYDQWDGYPASRARILEHLERTGRTNTVVLTGDIHLAGLGELVGPSGQVVATELVGTSISSLAALPPGTDTLVADLLPSVRYVNASQRGWLRCEVTPDRWLAEYRVVADNLVDGSPVTVDRTFELSPERPGLGDR